jgi:TrkA domain protein
VVPEGEGQEQGMSEVREVNLPGVGVRHDFTTDRGLPLAVLVHHDGRRELLVYDKNDPDACSSTIKLTIDESRTLSELLGASQVAAEVSAAQHEIEGAAIQWIQIPVGSDADGTTIGAGGFRAKLGTSIIAVIRDREPIPAPDADFELQGDDMVVAVGSSEGLHALRALLRP